MVAHVVCPQNTQNMQKNAYNHETHEKSVLLQISWKHAQFTTEEQNRDSVILKGAEPTRIGFHGLYF